MEETKKENRSAVVPVRFTETERTYLRNQSEARCTTVSDIIRRLCLSKTLPNRRPPAVNLLVYEQLCRFGNNFNQYVKAIHEGRAQSSDDKLLKEVTLLLRKIGHQLICCSA